MIERGIRKAGVRVEVGAGFNGGGGCIVEGSVGGNSYGDLQ